jgi:stress-induced-phosphoprotein 1
MLPVELNKHFHSALQDPRMIDALGVLMGIDIQAQTRPEGSSEGFPQQEARPQTPPPAPSPSSAKKSEPEPTPPQQQDVEMEELDEEEAKAKKDAEASKKAGTEAYKKRDFDIAIQHFEKAWDLYPKDITFLSNAGGMGHVPFSRLGICPYLFFFLSCIFRKGGF